MGDSITFNPLIALHFTQFLSRFNDVTRVRDNFAQQTHSMTHLIDASAVIYCFSRRRQRDHFTLSLPCTCTRLFKCLPCILLHYSCHALSPSPFFGRCESRSQRKRKNAIECDTDAISYLQVSGGHLSSPLSSSLLVYHTHRLAVCALDATTIMCELQVFHFLCKCKTRDSV